MGDVPPLETFAGREGSTFAVHREGGDEVELVLQEVDTSHDTRDGRERFSLLFRGADGTRLDQGFCRLAGPRIDPFGVVLVPVLGDDPDPEAVYYQAVVDRNVPGREPTGVRSDAGTPSRRGVLGGALAVVLGGGLLSRFASSNVRAAEPAGGAVTGLSAEPLVGSVGMFAGSFAPRGWAFCHGQLLPISQHTALFSILGTTYGGDGRTTFGLPDLRGRVPVGAGAGPGLTDRRLGETGGRERVALSTAEMPAHAHPASGDLDHDLHLPVTAAEGNATTPDGNLLAAQASRGNGRGRGRGPDSPIYSTGDADGSMDLAGGFGGDLQVGSAGGGQPHGNLPPYQAVNYVIALVGIFPSRN